MKHTPLHQIHLDAGAKMGEFAGFDMPLFYPLGVMKEHLHTRANAGLFDISHMVHVSVEGPQAAGLISRVCPYQAADQEIGQARYTFFLTENAGIIDDLIVTRLGDARYLIVANAGCAEKDVVHIKAVAEAFDCTVSIIPRGFVALQGPAAEAVLSEHFDVANMAFMTGTEPQDGWFLSRTGYTGEDGFEIGMPEADCAAFAEKLLADDRVEWIGLGARDSLRLEAGLPLYGQDLSEEISPSEAGLIWAIPKDLRSDGGFIGAGALTEKLAAGRKRMRIGLLPEGRPVRGGAVLVDEAGAEIGTVTSGGFGPTIDGPMAMGLVSVDAADNPIFADMRGKKIPMKRVKLPFAPHNYKRERRNQMSKIYFTDEHEWLSVDGDVATVGITNHAQEQLGDLVFVDLPDVGTELEKGDDGVVVESVKAASDVYAPVSGEVVEVNEALGAEPAKVNASAEGDGWLYKMKLSDASELEELMDAEGYKALIG